MSCLPQVCISRDDHGAQHMNLCLLFCIPAFQSVPHDALAAQLQMVPDQITCILQGEGSFTHGVQRLQLVCLQIKWRFGL